MNSKIQTFIEDHIWEIDKNLFYALYEVLAQDEYINGLDICDFTKSLYEADIDPLNYMDGIPSAFRFQDDSITVVDIRNGIKKVSFCAFFDCSKIKKIYFPQSLNTIETQAFWGCDHIEELTIMNPYITMEDDSFSNIRPIEVIHYNGKKQTYIDLNFPFVGKHVYCIDGELENT